MWASDSFIDLYDNMVLMRKFVCVLFICLATVFAAKPKPIETDCVKVVYVVDGMENEKVKAIKPRSVLDSILQDVDSVYLAHYGSCLYDNFGDGQMFFSFYEKNQAHGKFYGNRGSREICSHFTDSLDLVFKLKDARKINVLADSLKKKRKPHPKKHRKDIDIVSYIDSLQKPVKKEDRAYADSVDLEKMRKFDSLLKSGKRFDESINIMLFGGDDEL